MISKKTGHKTRRQKKNARYRKLRPSVREAAYKRDSGRCVFPTCRKYLWLNTGDPYMLANMHELVPRSLGGDPCDLDNVVTTCNTCHDDIHHIHKKRIDGKSVEAGLRFFERATRKDAWEEVGHGSATDRLLADWEVPI